MADDAAENMPDDSDRQGGKAPKKARSFWKELPILIVIALVLTFVIQHFLARPYMIPSGSMQQTLHGCPGCTPDRVLVDKLVYRFSDPRPGDVVVFRGPPSWTMTDAPVQEPANPVTGFLRQLGSLVGLAPPDERDFVKRIIALGGQTVECCDDENRVLVDGKPLDEPYLYFPGSDRLQGAFPPVEIPEGSMWVMGDNRNRSSDSRVQGTVPVDAIVGKARVIILPLSRWGGVSDHNPQGGHD